MWGSTLPVSDRSFLIDCEELSANMFLRPKFLKFFLLFNLITLPL
jgi:hypothetical protein